MNQMSFAVAQAQAASASLRASQSRIRDANFAQEAARLTKSKILIESGLAAMSHANISSQSVLQLLKQPSNPN